MKKSSVNKKSKNSHLDQKLDKVCSIGCICELCVPAATDAGILCQQGLNLFKAKRYKRSASAFTKAIKNSRLNPVLYLHRSLVYIKLDLLQEALQDAHRVTLLDPKSSRGLHRLGLTYVLLGIHATLLSLFLSLSLSGYVCSVDKYM